MQISKAELARIKSEYPKGTRVRLVEMNDPWMGNLKPGELGTVRNVDANGTIHVNWDCGRGLGIVYGADKCEIVKKTV